MNHKQKFISFSKLINCQFIIDPNEISSKLRIFQWKKENGVSCNSPAIPQSSCLIQTLIVWRWLRTHDFNEEIESFSACCAGVQSVWQIFFLNYKATMRIKSDQWTIGAIDLQDYFYNLYMFLKQQLNISHCHTEIL